MQATLLYLFLFHRNAFPLRLIMAVMILVARSLMIPLIFVTIQRDLGKIYYLESRDRLYNFILK